MKVAKVMTKSDMMELGLRNIDRWYGYRNKFEVVSLGSITGFCDDLGIKVIMTDDGRYGACALMNLEYLEALSREFDSNLIIIPSSIHELLVVKESEFGDAEFLIDTIKSVNESEVHPSEQLGDEPLFYKKGSRTLTIYH